MSNNQKTPFITGIQRLIEDKIGDYAKSDGQSLPCSVIAVTGAIVTVNFDISTPTSTYPPVTCPIIGSKYLRTPIKIGDKGVCVSADALLGGVSGLGIGNLGLSQPSNLGALFFVPLGNTAWSVIDPTSAHLESQSATATLDVTDSGVTINYAGQTLIINSAGITLNNLLTVTSTSITMTGNVTINGRPFLTHEHTGVTTGAGVSGGVL